MELKGVLESSDVNEIKAKTEELQQASHKLAEAVYAQANAEQSAQAGGNGASATDGRGRRRGRLRGHRRRGRGEEVLMAVEQPKDNPEETLQQTLQVGESAEEVELEALRAENEELHRHAQRVKAEFDNYRKRAARDQESLVARAGERIVKELLPVLDDLERALEAAHAHEEAKLEEGVELVHRQLEQILDREGLGQSRRTASSTRTCTRRSSPSRRRPRRAT